MDSETREMFIKVFDALDRMERSMKTEFGELKADVVEVKADITELKTDVVELKADMKQVKADIIKLNDGQQDIVLKLGVIKEMYLEHDMDIRLLKKKIV